MIDALRDANPRQVRKHIICIAKCCVFVIISWVIEFWFVVVVVAVSIEQVEKIVVENILAFDEVFWIRLAARSDTCKSEDDKAWVYIVYVNDREDFLSSFVSTNNALWTVCFLQKDYEELATTVMTIVDCVVNKTRVYISSLLLGFIVSSSFSVFPSIHCIPVGKNRNVYWYSERDFKTGYRGIGRDFMASKRSWSHQSNGKGLY